MKRVAPSLILLCFGMLAVSPRPAAQAADLSGEEIFQNALKSTVRVVVFDGDLMYTGSGSLIDVKERLILTNYHVVMMAKKGAFVQFPLYDSKGNLITDRKTYDDPRINGAILGQVLFVEKSKDLAIIQLPKLPKNVDAVKMGEKSPSPAADVHSVGNPAASGALFAYTPGKVRSVYLKEWAAKGGDQILNFKANIIEATSSTSAGDSGGPLFNNRGEQIGVTQGGLVSDKATGYSYFIDMSEVREMLRAHKVTLTASKGSSNTPKETTPPSEMEEPAKKETVTSKTDSKTKPEPKPEPKKESSAVLDERKAQGKLDLAKTLVDQGKKEVAVRRLEDLVQEYPNTTAAKEAKDLLKKLK